MVSPSAIILANVISPVFPFNIAYLLLFSNIAANLFATFFANVFAISIELSSACFILKKFTLADSLAEKEKRGHF